MPQHIQLFHSFVMFNRQHRKACLHSKGNNMLYGMEQKLHMASPEKRSDSDKPAGLPETEDYMKLSTM